jgi:hypothetical protein
MSTTKKTTAKKTSSSRPTAPSNVAAFKKKRQGKLLELPSGLWMRCQRIDLQQMIVKGSIPNPLMEIVSQTLEKGQKADIAKMVGVDEGKLDLDMIRDMYEMVNWIVHSVSQEPKAHMPPSQGDVDRWNAEHPDEEPMEDPEELRSDDLLYTDEVDDDDKMFLFQWLMGGTEDLATFREEARADMDALAEIAGSKNSTESADGSEEEVD